MNYWNYEYGYQGFFEEANDLEEGNELEKTDEEKELEDLRKENKLLKAKIEEYKKYMGSLQSEKLCIY